MNLKFQNLSENASINERSEDGSTRGHVFPPDFVHGNAELDELYGSFDGWAERLTFVRPVFVGGRCVAVSVARFDDWFLTIEHRRLDELQAIEWIRRMNADQHGVVIELALDGALGQIADEWVVVECNRQKLEVMECDELDVTREAGLNEESWWQTAQTDLLSLVCLTARLGRLN